MSEQQPEYWFPARRYGWGWGPPIRWQGWVVLISWLIAFVSAVGFFIARRRLLHVAFASGMVIVFSIICYRKG
jgi:hypothetical protein